MFDSLVACAVDRWPHDSGARRVWLFCTAMVTNEGRKVRSGYLPFGTNASTLSITPKRSSSRDVGTSSYRYHTATSPSSVCKGAVLFPFSVKYSYHLSFSLCSLYASGSKRMTFYPRIASSSWAE
ncbi:hypothetical protein TNCV_1284771 [Trichonephila clavipes]|uniref:Uncharacterized protein n=1 Tax=Trichonephila clavipes TaxID=2585209 RepID=A0A8X6VES5_TRICX|nr:hypothetical protein TNCV_1284771 [Trichonephila clavipes]